MREIKFRAKIEDRWKYFSLSDLYWMGEETGDYHFPDGTSTGETLGQYTGLLDKNGVEIYEGDVVYLAGFGEYTVEFPFIDLYEAYPEGDIGAILGNIHQNQELLK